MLLAAFGFSMLLWMLSPILAPFLAAAILAYIFDPLVTKLQDRGIGRTVGAVIAILVLLLAVALLLLIVLPLFYKELAQLFEQIPNVAEQLKTRVLPWINEKLGSAITLDPASFRQFITDNLSDASGIAKRVFASIGVGGVALARISSLARRFEPKRACISFSTHSDSRISSSFRTTMLALRPPTR